MKLLVMGANGLLGVNLCMAARLSHDVIGVDRGVLINAPFEVLHLDLLEAGAIDNALVRAAPEVVINCAALANVDACERNPVLARQTNADLPGLLAESCDRRSIRLVHISTDAVFDGEQAHPYTELDEPKPTSVYAETKIGGERAVLSTNSRAIVARVNFYGWSVSGTRSIAEFFVNNLRKGRSVRGFVDVRFCPLFVLDLANLLLKMLEAELDGLYHVVGEEPMSKYDFGVSVARVFGWSGELINPDSVDKAGLAARRAHNLELSVHKLSTALAVPYPKFSAGLQSFYQQAVEGYPQMIMGYQQPAATASPPSSKESS